MLEALYAGALEDASSRAEQVSTTDLENIISRTAPSLDVLAAFAPRESVHVLAEIKRASPSKGRLAAISNPEELASIYQSAGASGISVLTEERKFLGSLDDFDAVRARVDIPLLRKDFIANEYQILEARAHGADIVLLIVAGLDLPTLKRLYKFTLSLGMTPFVETHSRDELETALELDTKFVGINARDLSTFETDRDLFGSLAGIVPAGVIKVAESAVRNVDDVRHYRSSGADVVLVGEALVTSDAAEELADYLGVK